MSRVQIPAPRPYSLSFARAAISSRLLNGAPTTGLAASLAARAALALEGSWARADQIALARLG
jgi:hypothetical protein